MRRLLRLDQGERLENRGDGLRPSTNMDLDPIATTEEYSFVIPDLVIAHFADKSIVTVRIRYLYKPDLQEDQYVDFNQIAQKARDFLTGQSDPNVFWEILNKKLALMILEQFPVIVSLTSELTMKPTSSDHFVNSSVVTSRR